MIFGLSTAWFIFIVIILVIILVLIIVLPIVLTQNSKSDPSESPDNPPAKKTYNVFRADLYIGGIYPHYLSLSDDLTMKFSRLFGKIPYSYKLDQEDRIIITIQGLDYFLVGNKDTVKCVTAENFDHTSMFYIYGSDDRTVVRVNSQNRRLYWETSFGSTYRVCLLTDAEEKQGLNYHLCTSFDKVQVTV